MVSAGHGHIDACCDICDRGELCPEHVDGVCNSIDGTIHGGVKVQVLLSGVVALELENIELFRASIGRYRPPPTAVIPPIPAFIATDVESFAVDVDADVKSSRPCTVSLRERTDGVSEPCRTCPPNPVNPFLWVLGP